MSGKLRQILGKKDISETPSESSYNKKAIPFELDNEVHVDGLNAITTLFANPWTSGRSYTRADLATDVAEFFCAIRDGKLKVVPAEEE